MTKRTAAAATAPATVSDVRQRNRSQALRSIILSGSTTRAEIARDSGLSIASVTNLVSELIAEGLVIEAGTVASSGGRPVTLIQPNPSGAYLLVAFQPAATAAEIEQILGSVGGNIVDGPRAGGLFKLRIGEATMTAADRKAVTDRLAAEKDIVKLVIAAP